MPSISNLSQSSLPKAGQQPPHRKKQSYSNRKLAKELGSSDRAGDIHSFKSNLHKTSSIRLSMSTISSSSEAVQSGNDNTNIVSRPITDDGGEEDWGYFVDSDHDWNQVRGNVLVNGRSEVVPFLHDMERLYIEPPTRY